MSSLTVLDEIAPEFSHEPDRANFITRAALQLDATRFGNLLTEAVVRLAAHTLELRRRAKTGHAGAGPVGSQSGAGASVTYGGVAVSGRDAIYTTTSHGLEYLRLRNLVRTGPLVLNGTNSV